MQLVYQKNLDVLKQGPPSNDDVLALNSHKYKMVKMT